VIYAGWWTRVGAYVLDLVVLGLILFAFAIVGYAVGRSAGLVLMLILWVVFAWLGYWIILEGGERGQTVGKRMFGICVRGTSGERAGYGRAFGRNLIARVIGVFPLIGLVDLLWPIWDSRKQCLHDKAASTVVVRR
jgi:uncharacterized RDD family membrane protein YckC